jgi:hypothetical protein
MRCRLRGDHAFSGRWDLACATATVDDELRRPDDSLVVEQIDVPSAYRGSRFLGHA